MTARHPSLTRLLDAAESMQTPVVGPAALARALAESAATVTNWGARGVSKGGAANAQSRLGISTTWVLNGVGPMFVGGSEPAVQVAGTEIAPGYLRVEQIDATAGMGGAVINDDHPEIIRSVEYREAYIRALIGFVPPPGRLKLVTGAGDSMRPIIEPGETLLMDSGVTTFQADGIYWIALGDRDDGHQIKMLQERGDGLWVISANPAYPPFPFPENGRIGGRLYIKHKIERFS